jgi:hypothetical protein
MVLLIWSQFADWLHSSVKILPNDVYNQLNCTPQRNSASSRLLNEYIVSIRDPYCESFPIISPWMCDMRAASPCHCTVHSTCPCDEAKVLALLHLGPNHWPFAFQRGDTALRLLPVFPYCVAVHLQRADRDKLNVSIVENLSTHKKSREVFKGQKFEF